MHARGRRKRFFPNWKNKPEIFVFGKLYSLFFWTLCATMSNRRDEVLSLNIGAARGLQSVLASNLGPKGTIKMLVSGSGDIKLTKDGHVLLNEMQIASPTAALIARVATAQDEITGDGTSSSVLLIGELMNLSAQWLNEKVHPAMLTEGFERAKRRALETLEQHKVMRTDPEVLLNVARTSLRTKVRPELAENLAQIVLRAVDIVREEDKPIDLLMVEQMLMTHRTDMETRLIEGLVLDHGTRHPDMSRVSRNAHILILNVSLEYEKTEVNSSVFYANAKD